MSTLLVACYCTISAVVASYEKDHSGKSLDWRPVEYLPVYMGAALLLVVVVATCTARRERVDSKGPLGTDLVEHGVLQGERTSGPCGWLSRRWPWSPAPVRAPSLALLPAGLTRSTHPLLRYHLLEKRHVHRVRAALCVLRTDLQELQELAEKEEKIPGLRRSSNSSDAARDMSSDAQRGSVTNGPIAQDGTVFSLESRAQRVSWSQSTEGATSGAELHGESRVEASRPEDVRMDTVVVTGDPTQDYFQVGLTEFAHYVNHPAQVGPVAETATLRNFPDAGDKDSTQPITVMETTTQSSAHFKDVAKAKSYPDLYVEEAKEPADTVSIERTLSKTYLSKLRQEQNAIDLERNSHSEVLAAISGSNRYLDTYQQLHKQSQIHDFSVMDSAESESQWKPPRYTSTQTSDPEPPPSLKEVPRAVLDATTQHPDAYISVLDEMSEMMLHKKEAARQKSEAEKRNREAEKRNGEAEKRESETEMKNSEAETRKSETENQKSETEKRKNETEEGIESKTHVSDTDNATKCFSACFLHDVAPLSQQDQQSNEQNTSKSEQHIPLHSEQQQSTQFPPYGSQTEYEVAAASVEATNNPFFSCINIATESHNVKCSSNNVANDLAPELQTLWDLLHSFPCGTNVVQKTKMDTKSQLNPVSRAHSGIRQHNELPVHLSCKGDDVLGTKHQESCNRKDRTSGSRQKDQSAEHHISALLHDPSSSRTGWSPVSDLETATNQQVTPNTQSVLHWRFTFCPNIADGSSGHTTTPDNGPSEQ